MTVRVRASVGGEGLLSRLVPRRWTPTGVPASRDVRSQMKGIVDSFTSLVNHIESVTPDALLAGLGPIFEKSQEYCPIDTGTLRESGFMEAERTWRGASAVIGYAPDNDPFYGAIVHERMDLNHEPPTRAKFLEIAIMEEIDGFPDRVAAALGAASGISG